MGLGIKASATKETAAQRSIRPGSRKGSYGHDRDEKGSSDDESDLEAATGLEAMRIIEKRGALSGNASFVTDDQGHLTQEAQDESSDTDYKPTDFGLVDGGCETRMSYGNDLAGLNTSLNRKPQEQSQSLPSSSNASQKPISLW